MSYKHDISGTNEQIYKKYRPCFTLVSVSPVKWKKLVALSVVLNVNCGSQNFLIRERFHWQLVAGSDGSAKEILYHTRVSTILALDNHTLSLKGFETCIAPDIIFPKFRKGILQPISVQYQHIRIHGKMVGVIFLSPNTTSSSPNGQPTTSIRM